jgi:hypothetical protein
MGRGGDGSRGGADGGGAQRLAAGGGRRRNRGGGRPPLRCARSRAMGGADAPSPSSLDALQADGGIEAACPPDRRRSRGWGTAKAPATAPPRRAAQPPRRGHAPSLPPLHYILPVATHADAIEEAHMLPASPSSSPAVTLSSD